MAKINKYGTFSGVFTPSILTILGVIMYLRFPAIIGQAGLINTIGIIVIAHIISITTSLSVASLSTDKPVLNGGTYFMISRSLGLPIGGTLGLALFVGLSFSVSLYLIGFAESFLQYWGMEVTINSIRLAGSIVLVAVTTITFISTSLAIKSQYFIMAAIVLSLISIFFGSHEFTPETVNLEPLATSAPFMVLFGIFFPAVTGFEAGVSMSGDLQNPKKSLPYGAMLAVGVGFIVYIGLALFYAFTVNADALTNDPQILFKISLVPALVIAGIWGATLSSALGSILGAPRILQAIAMDKIAPKVFAKGTGKSNEPRNALLLAFVIAEAGILIGELDVIARIVSMFFITTYAFLNLASAIESWSSSDFRPAFRIPRFVSILGALSAFIVMILLDLLALAGATIVLGLLYFFLQRKELILESGDAWSSFWTNLAKKALLQLSVDKAHKRNWRPNIILFSGGERVRPHLVEMGLALSGKLGALTDFSLSIDSEAHNNADHADPKIKKKKGTYFTRQLNCNSVSEGIKSVTNIYGFSGFEPNTVLLGWSKSSDNTAFLSDILRDLNKKMLNAIFLDYNKDNSFGDRQSIDIWWNGKGRHLSFSLNILRFLLSDTAWRDAHVRILIINSDTSLHDSIYRNTNAILLDKRIKATVKVISNDFGSRTTAEIIKAESAKTCLLILGLSQKNTSFNTEYITKVNTFCTLPSSVLLLSPSAEFEEINLLERQVVNKAIQPEVELSNLPLIPEMATELVNGRVTKLDSSLQKIGNDFCSETISTVGNEIQSLASAIEQTVYHLVHSLERDLGVSESHESQKDAERHHSSFLRGILKITQTENKETIQETETLLHNGIVKLQARIGNFVYELPETITIPYSLPKGKELMFQYPYQKAVSCYIGQDTNEAIKEQLSIFENDTKALVQTLRDTVLKINDQLEKLVYENQLSKTIAIKQLNRTYKTLNNINDAFSQTASGIAFSLAYSLRQISIKVAQDLSSPESGKIARKKIKKNSQPTPTEFNTFAENWGSGMQLLNNAFSLDILVLSKKMLIKNILLKGIVRVEQKLQDDLFSKQKLLTENLNLLIQDSRATSKPAVFPDSISIRTYLTEAFEKAIAVLSDMPKELLLPEQIYLGSGNVNFSTYNAVPVDTAKTAQYYTEQLLNEPMHRDFEQLEQTLKHAIIEGKEANSMILFHQSNVQSLSKEDLTFASNILLFKKLLKQTATENEQVTTAMSRIQHYTSSYISEAFSKLFYHSIISSAKSIHSGEREVQKRKVSLSLVHLLKKAQQGVNNVFIYLLNTAGRGVILSKIYLKEQKYKTVEPKKILDLVEKLLPDHRIHSSIPVFYSNLMSSSSKITDEFWIARNKEMDLFKEALSRHKRGFGGAVFITGVHGAGKTTIIRHAVNKLFKPQNIIWINAPMQGTTNPADLLTELNKQTGNYGDYSEIFNIMPSESVIIINDFELWWERRPGGGDAIETILDLIKTYGTKVLFVINSNIHAFNAMQPVYSLSEKSLATISCNPFTASELQQMIINRHKSSGITLSYKGKMEDRISPFAYSMLFNKYLNVCEGIPGIAINTWKSNIIHSKSDTIEIKTPEQHTPGVLEDVPNEWLLLFTIFLHHKSLTIEKLSRITGKKHEQSADLLRSVFNTGILVKKPDLVYYIGRNIEPLITSVCERKGLI